MNMGQYRKHVKRINKMGRVFTTLYENSDIGNTHKKSYKKSLLDYSSYLYCDNVIKYIVKLSHQRMIK